MIKRILNKGILDSNINIIEFKTFMLTFLKKYNYIYVKKTEETQNIDKILSKKILQHLHIFFKKKPTGPNANANTNKTKRHKNIKKNKTRKNS
jgi:hypothetical protein